jgi:adenylate cyclase
MAIAASHGAEVALSDEMLREAGSDCPLRTSGSLVGPTEVNIRGRSGSLNIWLWRSDKAAGL